MSLPRLETRRPEVMENPETVIPKLSSANLSKKFFYEIGLFPMDNHHR